MKTICGLAAAALIASTAAGFAQDTVVTTGKASTTVKIEPETRTRIKTYITEHHVRPIESREKIVVGTTVPRDVELEAVPSDWGPSLTHYRYVYSGDHIMLVDPGSRRVVEKID